MRKQHHKTLKFHTIFSIVLVLAGVTVLILKPSWLLAVSWILLLAYVAGNGIIHSRKNQLTRDSLLEYIIVAAIAVLILVGAAIR